uniref:Particulate methane monooxygenase A-subunit n=1 Tax=Haliea sp. ETY-M TaxID=1055105 RepID=J7M7D0_9GAMM|nr:putative ethylene monooxygenase protein A [Haliea sp. ETY-M]BBD50149.1 particulate methane monooxygenase A-subunit [Haliea sp. ETY-M]
MFNSNKVDPVLQAAGLRTPAAISSSRAFDIVIATLAIFLMAGSFHIHFMLLAGDWDFWVDWKDRQFWVSITPVVAMVFPAAAQAWLWRMFRVPFGATFVVLCLILAEWISRIFAFNGWVHFPYSLVWPATMIPGAIVLDMVLLLTRSWLMTGIFGAWAFGLMFYPGNWPMLAAYRLPMEHMGQLATSGDLIGYHFVRSATPEYLRYIERGTLRTFGGESAIIASFFAAFMCSLVYFVFWHVGVLASKIHYLPNQFKKFMGMGGMKDTDTFGGHQHVGEPKGAQS